MVNTPKTRHSKSQREPVTIELEPGAVARLPAEDSPAADPSEAQPADSEPVIANAADAAQAEATDSVEKPDVDVASASPSGYDFDAEKPRDTAETPPKFEPAGASYGTASSPAAKKSGFSPIAAGIIGGVIALAGAGGLQYFGLLGTPGATGAAPGLDGVQAEIAALKQDVATLKSAGGGDASGLSAALDQVKAEVASLQQAISAGAGGENAGLQALDGRIKEIETAIANLGKTEGGGSSAEIAAIGERIAGLEALVKAAGDAVGASDGRLAALEQTVTALSGKIDAQAAQPKIALAIATAALKAAVERGAPFSAELETFAAIAPDAPEIPALRSHAETGVATRAVLIEEADAAANAMIAAATPADQNAGFFDRLLNSAESLVTVRPIGAVEGAGVPETVARMEFALKSGDLAAAMTEFDTLPDPVKAAGGVFAEKVRARLEVERLVDQAVAGAMKAA